MGILSVRRHTIEDPASRGHTPQVGSVTQYCGVKGLNPPLRKKKRRIYEPLRGIQRKSPRTDGMSAVDVAERRGSGFTEYRVSSGNE